MKKVETAETLRAQENKIKEVKTAKKRLSKRYLLLYAAIFGFTLYSAITIINTNIAIEEKEKELAALKHKQEIVEIENKYLEEVMNYKGEDLDEFVRDKARKEYDYVNNGERVFVNISGN